MNQFQTPLFDAMYAFHKKHPISLHVPGHKNGLIFHSKGNDLYQPLLSVDLTELTGLDDLHAPEDAISDSEKLLTELYGVRKSYFLVNGSTVGNIAMILAACKEGDRVLVQRNCHKSVLHALMLANVQPIFLKPVFYEEWGVAGGIKQDTVEAALRAYPDTRAVIITHPNYYGLGESLSDLVALCHSKGIAVLVDEAHGAHYRAGSSFPKSAVTAGADAIVHSAHKTLPAMTMGSFLHLNSSLIDQEMVEFYLQMLQSSSPSYPIMGSLDLARSFLASYTSSDEKYLLNRVNNFRRELNDSGVVRVLETPQGASRDPLKVTIQSTHGLSGYELQEALEAEGVYAELADSSNVLLILPLLKKEEEYPFDTILQKIRLAAEGKEKLGGSNKDISPSWETQRTYSELALSYSAMKKRKKRSLKIEKSAGEIAAEMVIPYPPGIPLIMTGEMITPEHLLQLKDLLSEGSRFHGGSCLPSGELIVYESNPIG